MSACGPLSGEVPGMEGPLHAMGNAMPEISGDLLQLGTSAACLHAA